MRVPFSVPADFIRKAFARFAFCAGIVGAVLGVVFSFGELTHLRSSRRRLGDGRGVSGRATGRAARGAAGPGAGRAVGGVAERVASHAAGTAERVASCAAGTAEQVAGGDQIIVVLGYGNRGERANGINRFRVRAGLRTIDPRARSAVLILCGGAVAGRRPEAMILERFAREELGFTGRTLLETQSATTWENILNAIPLIDEELRAESTISIVSNSHHAEKARDHLWQLRPDLGRRLVRGGDYRCGELPVVKPIAAVRGLLALRELDRSNSL